MNRFALSPHIGESSRAPAVAKGHETPWTTTWGPALWSTHPPEPALTPCAMTAHAWAQLIMRYWNFLDRMAALDLSQPLYVVDLAPHDGRFAGQLLEALQAELLAQGSSHWPVRYLLCPLHPWLGDGDLGDLHTPLQAFADQGWLLAARWSGQRGHPIYVGHQAFPVFGVRNPMAVVNYGGTSAMPSRLWSLDFGNWQVASARVLAGSAPAQTLSAEFDWRAVAAEQALSDSVTAQLQRYQKSVLSAPIVVHEGLLEALDSLDLMTAGSKLLLVADEGVHTLSDVSTHALDVAASLEAGLSRLPVNFDALAHHERSLGARVACDVLHGMGTLVACRHQDLNLDDATWQAWVRPLASAHPALGLSVETTLATQPSPAVVQLLHAVRVQTGDWARARRLELMLHPDAHWDLAELSHQLGQLAQRLDQDGLAPESALALLVVAGEYGLWSMVRHLAAQMDRRHLDAPQRGCVLWWLAQCEAATGFGLRASQHLGQIEPDHAWAESAAQQAATVHSRWTRDFVHPWNCIERRGPLCLELLDAVHGPALLWQCRDPSMVQIAGLPLWEGLDSFAAYATAIDPRTGADWAVVHQDWGPIGLVGMRCVAQAAYVFFWIGLDFQGQGWARTSLDLLHQQMPVWGLRHVFATVDERNLRCLDLIQRLGYEPFAAYPLEPADTTVHWYRAMGESLPATDKVERLQALHQIVDGCAPI